MARQKAGVRAPIDWEDMHTRDILEQMKLAYGEILQRQQDLDAVHGFVSSETKVNTPIVTYAFPQSAEAE